MCAVWCVCCVMCVVCVCCVVCVLCDVCGVWCACRVVCVPSCWVTPACSPLDTWYCLPQLPQTSEVLCAVPNCISALCLNEVIRRTVVSTQPFDRLLKTLISPEYHLTMKKHNRGDRSTVPNTIGVCVDQLLRHQTELRGCFMDALMRVSGGRGGGVEGGG